jgi:hypothetical protein
LAWVRLDDHFSEHPKIASLSDPALALWVTGLAYCNRNLTDGFIPKAVGIGQLRWCEGNTAPAIAELETAGLWDAVEGGWQVHDFDEFQPSREQVEAERENKQRAGRAGGLAAARARAQARSQAPATAPAKAESKPVPVPVPVPETRTQEQLLARSIAFERFWKAYPTEGRRDKPKVLRLFDRACSDGVDPEEIIAGAERYAADPNRGTAEWQTPTKYAQGWLSGERWNDPPLPRRQTGRAPKGDTSNITALADRLEGVIPR